ncbi:MAG TPA: SpoIID/LytB domain-containing protein, partial [Candidatus Cloacimonadota bacterium]|nr:SpoIID/LytB domain-containing protein [Candidatus Cloacimonadota bacterium]
MLRFLLLLLLTLSGLVAAEIRDGLLYLEINLASSTQLNLTARGGSVNLSDESMLFGSSVNGEFKVSVVNPEVSYLYGILEHSESTSQTQGADTVQSFAWEDGKLLIKNEIRYYYPESFSSSDSARAYAIKHGYPFSSIVEIPMVNSTLKVEESTGKIYYFESPLFLHSTEQLELNGLAYEGNFVLEIAQGKLQLNQFVALEEYIAGVLPNEIGPNSPLEALKAQAVAARTHAVSLLINNRHKEQGYDLCSSTHCQVYKGKHLRNQLIEEAVMQSASEILILDERVADAPYHSSCGGKTDSSANIWGSALLPHLSGSLCYPEASDFDLSTEDGVAAWLEQKPDTTGMSSWEKASLSWQRSISRANLASNLDLN